MNSDLQIRERHSHRRSHGKTMKPTSLLYHVVVTLLASLLCGVAVLAQEVDSKISPVKSDAKMPDLSGMWIFSVRVPLPKGAPLREINGDSLTFVVSRSREAGCDFEFREKQNARSPKMLVKWLPGTRRFQSVASEANASPEATLELSADGKLLRMQAALEPVEKKRLAEQLGIDDGDVERAFHQEFRREEPSDVAAAPQDKPSNSKPLSPAEVLAQSGLGSFNPQAQPTDLTKPVQINLQPATQLAKLLVERFADRGAKVLEYEEGKRLKVEAPPAVLLQLGDVLGKVFQELERSESKPTQSTSSSDERPTPTGAASLGGDQSSKRVLPDTPAAKQLVEQLAAQESAAAAEAATIRQLQSNGQAEQNKQPIAEHQRKLKSLLSTAFDLKLQLEDLQVKELQARLSRLERQVGQRKELREKIINRRATELIEGDALMWSSSDRPTVKTAPSSTLTATVLTTPPPTTNREEPTFDGVPYSQWVKLLESERKPDKLIKAMEACGTLATVGDERRIARGLLAAANRYEDADSSNERNNVWNAATKALKQLSGEAVIREMLAASNDEQVLGRHDFTSRFLVIAASSSRAAVSDRLRAAFKQHDRELVTLLLKKSQAVAPPEASANGSVMDDRSRRLLGAAVSVWLISDQKLGRFADLQPLVIPAIEEVYLPKPGRSQQINEPWRSAADRLAEQEPETPGLALMLSKHIAKDRQPIFGWLTQMGPHAEPAVPALIEAFLVHWKKRENRMRGTDTSNENDGIWPHSEEERMVHVLEVLGAIGPKAKSAAPLLRQITVTASAKRAGQPESLNDKLFDAVRRTLARIRDDSAAEPVESPTLLSDFARLQGVWTVTSLTPQADHKDIQFEFDGGLSILDKHLPDNFEVVRKVMSHLGLNSSGMDCRINDTVTPRQIEFTNMRQPHRQLGIYELQGSRLKIELAKPGLPFPKEFSSDPNKLPEGHVLVELQRDGELKPPAASPIKAAVLPTPEELKAKLKPFADSVTAAMQRVRDLEPTFLKDHSNLKEMQLALQQLARVRRELHEKLRDGETALQTTESSQSQAFNFARSRGNEFERERNLQAEGKSDAEAVRAAEARLQQANKELTEIQSQLSAYFELLRPLREAVGFESLPEPRRLINPKTPHAQLHPATAIAWLEVLTQLKLEYVPLQDLNLKYPAALRIREASTDYKVGDLIVVLNGYAFESLNEAVGVGRLATMFDSSQDGHLSIVLRDGLAGIPYEDAFGRNFKKHFLTPGSSHEAIVQLELQILDSATGKPKTEYVRGTCVSPEGLVVIPVTSTSLVPNTPITAFNAIQGTAVVVAANDTHGLTLLELTSPQSRLFQWLKCRTDPPTANQLLTHHHEKSGNACNSIGLTQVIETEQSYPPPFDGNDAFTVLTRSSRQDPNNELCAGSRPEIPQRGDHLIAVQRELQGLIVSSKAEPEETDEDGVTRQHYRGTAMPAVHIQKLIDDFRDRLVAR